MGVLRHLSFRTTFLLKGYLFLLTRSTFIRFTWLLVEKKSAPNMTMIETVRQRQKSATDFASYYDNLCALQNSCPLGSITANLDELTIDCNADRIRHTDWTPILNALKINKTLIMVAFRSYWQQTLYPDGGKVIDEFFSLQEQFTVCKGLA